ncbi:MAG: hypothetical protein ACK55I_13660, partial [bacterium]
GRPPPHRNGLRGPRARRAACGAHGDTCPRRAVGEPGTAPLAGPPRHHQPAAITADGQSSRCVRGVRGPA